MFSYNMDEDNKREKIYWDIQLDQDLLETIINIYPEWFREFDLNIMTDKGSNTFIPLLSSKESLGSPKSEVDEGSLQKSMDRNKESLKVKLMLRRPITQLVDQGIMPPLTASPGLYEQSKKLERARTGDFLKHKIQRRPDRQSLIQQHILEDTTVSPSLHDKQRQLKKARLADDLNDRLSHRPGPLELVKGNILLTDERFAQAVKEGQIQFKATCEGEPAKHPPPRFMIEEKEESSSDDAASPPQEPTETVAIFPSRESIPDIGNSSPITINALSPSSTVFVASPTTSLISSPSPISSNTFNARSPMCVTSSLCIQPVVNPMFTVGTNSPPLSTIDRRSPIQSIGPLPTNCFAVSSSKDGPTKTRKKSKSKTQPKTRTIKFHEYKGPPSAQKSHVISSNLVETSYELLLKQQQLFLQWQLEWQQKYPQIILPAAQKNNTDQGQQGTNLNFQAFTNCHNGNFSNSGSIQKRSIVETLNSNPPSANQHNISHLTGKIVSKLEDMKVSDLKAELKKRNLPVSGSKPQLIDRLKPYANEVILNPINSLIQIHQENVGSETDDSNKSNREANNSLDKAADSPDTTTHSPQAPLVVPMEVDSVPQVLAMDLGESMNGTNLTGNEVMRLHLQKNELPKELQNQPLQLQLQPILQTQTQSVTAIPLTVNGQQIHFLSTNHHVAPDSNDNKSIQRQIIQQHLQQKIQQQQQRQGNNNSAQISNGNASAAVKASLAAFLQQHQHPQQNKQTTALTFPTLLTAQVLDSKSIPTFQQLVLYPNVVTNMATNDMPLHEDSTSRQRRTNSLPNENVPNKIQTHRTSLPNFSPVMKTKKEPKQECQKPPPNYEEATKQIITKNNKERKKSTKSQAVDDVLEILIKNGELPPSAAQEPATPVEKVGLRSNLPFERNNSTIAKRFKDIDSKICKSSIDENEFSHKNNELTLDLDFTLELQELADSMDFNSEEVQESKDHENNMKNKKQSSLMDVKNLGHSSFSFNDLMEFQDTPISVDDTNWFSDIVNGSESIKSDANTVTHKMDVPENRLKSNNSSEQIIIGPSTSCNTSDPVLPNNMLDDPLIDIFFDEGDFKGSNEFGTLVWDRIDFAT